MRVPLARIRQTPQCVLLVHNAPQHHQDHLLVHVKHRTNGKRIIAIYVQAITFGTTMSVTCVPYWQRVFQAQVCESVLKRVCVQEGMLQYRKMFLVCSNAQLVLQARLKRMEHVLNVLLVHHHRP
jgi:hypothetical protein